MLTSNEDLLTLLYEWYTGDRKVTFTDANGKKIPLNFNELLAQDDSFFEGSHDYIQWLFPTMEKSRFNTKAPVINDETQVSVLIDADRMHAAAVRFLEFLTNTKENWTREGNHNELRITRIIKSLIMVGKIELAKEFYRMALYMKQRSGAGDSYKNKFWDAAIAPTGYSPKSPKNKTRKRTRKRTRKKRKLIKKKRK